MDNEKPSFDSAILFRIVYCVFFGACLYLYITNNSLLANGAHNLQTPEAIVMLLVFGIPFVLAVVYLIRSLRRPSDPQT